MNRPSLDVGGADAFSKGLAQQAQCGGTVAPHSQSTPVPANTRPVRRRGEHAEGIAPGHL